MPTLILVDGFEYAHSAFVTAGGGMATSVTNPTVITFDSTVKRTGGFSMKFVYDGANATNVIKTIGSTSTMVGSIYFRATAAPSVQSSLFGSNSGAVYLFRLETDGRLGAIWSGGTAQNTAGSVCDGAWHRIDWYADSVNNPYVLQWQVDASAQTNAIRNIAAASQTNLRLGTTGTTHTATFWLDDLVLSTTAGDYPIGEHSVFVSTPSSDGTHVNTGGGMEDNAGTDITTAANGLLSSWPVNTSVFLRQSVVGTGDYAEVNFSNADATVATIWDVSPMLAYTSSTNAANEGGCIISFDSFSTSTEVYGTPSARTNYQTASTIAPFFKVRNASQSDGVITRPGGGWTLTDFNALKARLGYSNDVTGNPRWLGLLVQYAATVSGGGGGGGGDADSLGELLI
jgi:hypothetical protein